MNDTPAISNDVPVTDHRPVPRGVLPRGMQTWLMVGVAVVMVAIIFATGRPEAPTRPTAAAMTAPAPNPERLRDYQDRLRAMEVRAAQEAHAAALAPPSARTFNEEPPASPAQDPIVADRKRREYESLFAGNLVLSRRPEAQRPDAGRARGTSGNAVPSAARDTSVPSIDDIADAAVRATTRANPSPATSTIAPSASQPSAFAPAAPRGPLDRPSPQRPTRTEPISDAGPLHRILEGTVIDTVLTNRLDGSVAAPVNCLVTNPIYSHSGQQVVIPAGARVLGETKPVQALGEARLAVAFHRVLMPDGSTLSLDQFLGLNQIGDAGLRDQVNQHYWSTFGAAAAVGLISGLAQFVGTAGLGAGDGNRTVVIAGGAADSTSHASVQTMNRFLNRLPTITIREGHRVKLYLTSDLELPEYPAARASGRF
jgi:type IV secretory pathway VirB10-like protein